MRTLALTVMLCGLSGALHAAEPPTPTTKDVEQAIRRGVDYLLGSQNADGSWGGPQNSTNTFTGSFWTNPTTHRSWRVATTGLCCLSLMKVGHSREAQVALDRGIQYLIDHAVVKRPSDWDVDNNWAYIYGLHSLAVAYGHPRYAEQRERIAPVIEQLMEKLATYQALSGGWGYYEFDSPRKRRPGWSTSFTTAAAVIALQEARRQGFEVDPQMVDRAIRGIKRCRLPSGAYTYSIEAVPDPRHSEWIDQIKGSLSRIQVCHEALLQCGEKISMDRLREGLNLFFQHHRFLDIARNKPIPHETYYYNSGYFYLFGHYYAALIIERLPQADQVKYWPKLQYHVIKTQQKEGYMWDFNMHSYDKPYGTSFSLLMLGHSIETTPAEEVKKEQEPVSLNTSNQPSAVR